MSKDYGSLVTIATNRDNEITELAFGNKHHYNRDHLYGLMLKVENDNTYKLLEPETCITIRQLRLNKYKCGKRGGTRKEMRHNCKTVREINTANLVLVHIKPRVDQDPGRYRTKQLHLLLSNIQSIKSKELLLLEHLNNNKIDIAVITEMWLNEDTDKAWVLTSGLNRNGFSLDTSNQIGKRGGGLAIISRSYLKPGK